MASVTVNVRATEIPQVKALISALDEFMLGVGLFAPQLLDLPVFVKLYDALQDVRRVDK
jgi:hypothetical protein